ncbi:hypothetical protein KQI89_15090 [Clostridium sp. MSJ-4]|uniref:Uncharacterized protein n=1 Tax=Clostridium simiarum TaxID=2841506 RepID=A0ABS6F3L4_9CLOT|nr:hypothetical protein [Clostridium simiarum]MBU5593074.1 hypothetical protein [Clostridium simiarum]
MKNSLKITLVLGLSAIILAAPFVKSRFVNNKTESKIPMKIHSLPVMYNTTEELVKNSDAIVEGIVEDLEPEYLKPVTSSGSKTKHIIFSRSQIKINKIFKGNIEDNRNIIVNQRIGDKINDDRFIEDSISPYRKGENVILFLKKDKDNFYSISPYQDKIEINNNENRSFNSSIYKEAKQDPNIFPMFKDMTIDQIKEDIEVTIEKLK